MPRPTPTEIRVNEKGDETHESWLLIRANNVSSSPGARLFDSEIAHQHYIKVTVSRCTRKRDLKRDWLHATQTLIEIDMSQAQWGAFVSSFGNGDGVPATLSFFEGSLIPGVSNIDSRLAQSHREVGNAATDAMAQVQAAHKAVQEAFDQKLGVKETRARLRNLQIRMNNLPSDLEYTAKTLTEHSENVVQKARADVEGMVMQALRNNTQIEASSILELD